MVWLMLLLVHWTLRTNKMPLSYKRQFLPTCLHMCLFLKQVYVSPLHLPSGQLAHLPKVTGKIQALKAGGTV
jgi:hypothetical protein